jgi:purine-binding chemotaxis protein CheW
MTGDDPSPEVSLTAERVTEFIGFELGTMRYALPLAQVRELMPVPAITEVPGAPVDVAGVMLLGGSVITVIDLARRLGVPTATLSERSRVILVQSDAELLGLLVSRVLGVYALRGDQIDPFAASQQDETVLVRASGKGRPSETASDALLLLDLEPRS